MLSPLQQIIYNVMYERGAQYVLRSESAIAAQYPGKPLWLYAEEGWGADNLRAFFHACLQKKLDLSGLVSSKWAHEICLAGLAGLAGNPLSASWEVAAFYLAQAIEYRPKGRLVFPSISDVPTLSEWIGTFYQEALSSEFKPKDRTIEALVAGKKLYCLEHEGIGLCAMGMRVPLESDDYKMGRLNMIYTPAKYRGMGFGKDITAAIAMQVQSQKRLPVLYARLNNKVAINLYRQLGFAEAGRLVEARFTEKQP